MPGGREKTGRRLPWGFLGMLGLVVSIERGFAKVDLDLTAPWHWDWRAIGKAASDPTRVRGRDLLFFGDSLLKFGLIPELTGRASGKSAYNLAIHTGQPSTSYFLLRRTLRAGARPSAVVLEATPHLLGLPPSTNDRLWPELLTAEECLDLSMTMNDPNFFAATMLGKALPSFKERHEIRAGLLAALGGGSTSKRREFPAYRENWKAHDGAQLMGDEVASPFDYGDWAGKLYSRWDPAPINLEYLDRFLGLAASRRIPVYWLLPPIHPEVQARTDASRYDADYSAFVDSVRARFPATIVVDARHSGFEADLFQDGAHVNRRGAHRLSAAFGRLLRDGTSSPGGWVALDLARECDPLLEPDPRPSIASTVGGEPAGSR